MNDWAALYSRGAYTRGDLYAEHRAKFAMLPTTHFMFRKNCTDFKQNHYIVYQSAYVIIISRFFDITSLNGGGGGGSSIGGFSRGKTEGGV